MKGRYKIMHHGGGSIVSGPCGAVCIEILLMFLMMELKNSEHASRFTSFTNQTVFKLQYVSIPS